jgi:iron complex outermembrane receptor protein
MRFMLLVITTISLSNLFAQQSTSTSYETINEVESSKNDNEKDIEKVEVTGSYIRRIDREGPAPVTKIEREDFFKTGSIDFMDVLREDPAFEGIYDGPGVVRMRGQSAGSVLILLNGMRLPKKSGGYYNSVKSFPASIMETTEILKDGGSALYGSDAMSGVINYKTRKDFDGAEVFLNSKFSEDGIGTQQSYSANFGKSFSKGNVLGVIQYAKSEAVYERELGSFRNSDKVAIGNSSVASIGKINFGETCGGRSCRFNDLADSQARPENTDVSALLTAGYNFNNGIKASLLGMYNRKKSLSEDGAGYLNWSNFGANATFDAPIKRGDMDTATANELDLAGAFSGDNLVIKGTFADEIGSVISEEVEDSLSVQAQVEGYIGDTWTWKVLTGASKLDSVSTTLSGEIDQAIARNLITSGAVNFVKGNIDLSSAFVTPSIRSYGEMYQAKAIATGELINFGNGGTLSAALGLEQQYETFRFDNDEVVAQGRTLGDQAENISGTRRVDSAFVELAYAPIPEVELNLSGRVDSYSDVGDTINPRFAFLVTPTRKFMLRGSIGTGFRAPGLTDVNGSEQRGIENFEDGVCDANGGENCDDDYDVTRFNSPDLKPESGLNYSVGTVMQFTKEVSLSVDQWNFEGTDSISQIDSEVYTQYESQYGAEAAAETGAKIVRNADGTLQSFSAPRVANLGERTLRGVDATIDLESNFNNSLPFTVGFSNGASYIFERTERRFALEELTEREKSWKLNNRISLSTDNHNVSLRALTTSSFYNSARSYKFKQHTTLDLSYAYNTSWNGRFNVVVKNIADREIPVDSTRLTVTRGFTARTLSSFSPIGRRIFTSYSQTF